jgi:hypothetical protein
MVPPFRRAYNQLNMKVRALPTWRKPVGEGAKRTRRFPLEEELGESDMVELSMVRGGKRRRQASFAAKWFACNPLAPKKLEGGHCT